MFHWIPYAFVRIVLFFIGGILLGIYLPDSIPLLPAIVLFITLLGLYTLLFFIRSGKEQGVMNPGLIGWCAIFLAGYLQVIQQTESRSADHFVHTGKQITFYRAVVSKFPQEKDK